MNTIESDQQCSTAESKTTGDFIRRQPLLAVSSLGAAIGSVKGLMRQLKRASSIKLSRTTQIKRYIPKYMKSNFVKYPALLVILLVTARKLRLMLGH